MRCILSPSNNPAFNLAAEEFLFRNFAGNLLLLYINSPAVIVGKHQNALAEINFNFIKENGIKVVRRVSGGGAVYHDLGNLNFSFHKTVEDTSKISFRIFSEPIAEVLNNLGVSAEINKRNDIVVNGFKVSGHAEHVFRNRIMSHGTLLVDANKENLSNALKSNEEKFKGKAIASVRSKIANLADFTPYKLTAIDLTNHLLQYFSKGEISQFSSSEISQIEQLSDEKYSQWDWNFGYSPKYCFENRVESGTDYLRCSVCVEKGVLTEAHLEGTVLTEKELADISTLLIGRKHDEADIVQALSASCPISCTELISKCLF